MNSDGLLVKLTRTGDHNATAAAEDRGGGGERKRLRCVRLFQGQSLDSWIPRLSGKPQM